MKDGRTTTLQFPVNGLKGKIKAGESIVIGLLPKIIPTIGNEIDNIEITLKAKEDKEAQQKRERQRPAGVQFN